MREIIVETTLPYTHLLYVRKYSIFSTRWENTCIVAKRKSRE